MKKISYLCIFVLSLFFVTLDQALAFRFARDGDYHFITVIEKKDSTEIYIKNYHDNKFLLYKSDFPFSEDSVIGVEHENNFDIISVDFDCDKKDSDMLCTRFFNRRTSQLSDIYQNLLDYNPKQNIVAHYIKSENLVVLTPLFEKCDHPLTYKINLYPDTDFGVKTKFLDNGNLQLDYVNSKNKDVIDVIPINYQQLYKDCGTHA